MRAGFEHQDPVAQEHGLVHVVGDHHDGLAHPGLDVEHLLLQALAGEGVHGAEGLVHEQHGWIRREAPRHADALLLSAGQLARETVPVDRRVQADQVEQLVHAVGDAPAVPLEQARHQADVLGDGQVGHHPATLHDVADLTAQPGGVAACDVLPTDQDPPGGGLDEAVDHLQRGGLAAAGRADEHHGLPAGMMRSRASTAGRSCPGKSFVRDSRRISAPASRSVLMRAVPSRW